MWIHEKKTYSLRYGAKMILVTESFYQMFSGDDTKTERIRAKYKRRASDEQMKNRLNVTDTCLLPLVLRLVRARLLIQLQQQQQQ